MRALKALVFLALAALALAGWRYHASPPPLWTERQAELEALMLVESITNDNASWREWASRAFIPASVLDAVGDQFVGATYSMPVGHAGNAGTFQLTLESFDLRGGAAWLESRAGVSIRYAGSRHEWSDTIAHVMLRGLILPRGRVDRTFYVRIVPIAIAPQLSWRKWTLETSERSLIAEAIAAGVVRAFTDRLLLPIALPESPVLSTKFSSRDTTPFSGGGSTEIVVDYPGKSSTLALPFDVALPSPQGLWLIARKPGASALQVPAAEVGPTPERIESLRLHLATRLAEWNGGASTTVTVATATLQDLLKQLLPPVAPREISVKTEKAQGAIGAIKNVRSEFVDNASAELRPASNVFADGTLTMGSVSPEFDAAALRLSIPVSLTARAALDLHLNPTLRIGSGIGAAFDAHGTSEATLDATFTGEIKTFEHGRAAVLQPLLPCKRVQIDITSEVAMGGLEKHTVGVRLQQPVGGDPMEPAVLLDDVPLFADYPPPDKSSQAELKWPALRLVFSFSPENALLGTSGLSVSTGVKIGRDNEPADSAAFKKRLADLDTQRADLHKALKDAAPASRCKDSPEVALLADGLEIGPNGDGVLFARKLIALAGEVSADMQAQIEAWLKGLADPTKPLQPPPDLGATVLKHVASGSAEVATRFGFPPPPPPPTPPPAPTGNPVEDVKNILSWRPW